MKNSNILRVLTYHRIADPADIFPSDPRLVSVTPEVFARQVEWLSKHYQVVDMSTVLNAISLLEPLPRNAVLITFDDAYPDFFYNAWPILSKYKLPATLFVPTAYPDKGGLGFWWDRLYAGILTTEHQELLDQKLGPFALTTQQQRIYCARTLQNYVKSMDHIHAMEWLDNILHCIDMQNIKTDESLSWEKLKSLSNEGVTICAHSRTHPMMTRINNQQVYDEISGSLGDIKIKLGSSLPVFCYPAGAHNQDTCRIAIECGVLAGFSVTLGHNKINTCDPLRLKRINITQRTTPIVLRGRLSRVGIHADILRHKLKQQLRKNYNSSSLNK